MHENEDDPERVQQTGGEFECPNCHIRFKQKKGLVRHLDYNCKMIPGASVLDGPRVPHHQPTAVVVKVDQEVKHLHSPRSAQLVTRALS